MSQALLDWLAYYQDKGMLDPMDTLYVRNQAMHLLGLESFEEDGQASPGPLDPDLIMDQLIDLAIDSGAIQDLLAHKEALEAALMNLVTPLPSQVNKIFWDKYQENPEHALAYFYQLSQDNRYIQTRAIAKNTHFTYQSPYGQLEITINLSKPEKDPKEIAAAKNQQGPAYPPSQLTMSNEGYYGRIGHPARSNHRIIRFDLGQDGWGFQYSPYAYFNEHAIFLSQVVRPMKVNRTSFQHLLEIVQVFPQYFVGSNADLPIVGGSILAHDHYQAGRHVFPMELAESFASVDLDGFDGTASLLVWPLSVIRLRSRRIDQLVDQADAILKAWQTYSDPDLSILSHSGETPHNTITPIARFKEGAYELDLVLRNNRTDLTYPDGIFHPHPDVQAIKKENIGLIEVMGLAILPPRLDKELVEVEKYLLGQDNAMNPIHQAWVKDLESQEHRDPASVHNLVQAKVGSIFQRVLEDAGVFKQDDQGRAGFLRFIQSLAK